MFVKSSSFHQDLLNVVGVLAGGVALYGYAEGNHSLTVAAAAVCAGSFFAVSRILNGSILRSDENERFRKVWSEVDSLHEKIERQDNAIHDRIFEVEDRLAKRLAEMVPQSEFNDYMRNTSDRFDEAFRNMEDQSSNICRMHDQETDALHRRIDEITDLTNECREACDSGKRSK